MAEHKSYCSVLLECGHVVTFRKGIQPKPGTLALCRSCDKYVKSSKINRKQWKARCKECKFSIRTGQDEAAALLHQVKHSQRTGHKVEVKYTNESEHEADPNEHCEPLDSGQGQLFQASDAG